MIIEVTTGESIIEFRYESDHVPAIGDRIVSDHFGYRVTERTWNLDDGVVELWTEKE